MNVKNYHIYVTDLLKVCGIENEGKELSLWGTLYHLLMAAALRDQLSREEQEQLKPIIKKLRPFFSTRFDLKERKGKQQKESFPPNPLLKNKQEKGLEEKTIYIADGDFSGFSSDEKEQPEEEKQTAKVVRLKGHQYLSATLRARQEAFAAELRTYDGIYTREALNDFFNYWAEENKETGEMLWETKKTWNLSKRLKRWVSNMYTNANSAAVIRMNRLKKQQAKEDRRQQIASELAIERRQADQQREADTEKAKKEAGGLDEAIANNPSGILAHVQRERQKREALEKGKEPFCDDKTLTSQSL